MVMVEFEFERATKNTFRFKEISDDPIIGILYVKKTAFAGRQPLRVSVALSEA